MHIVTPTEIKAIAWEGELALPEVARSFSIDRAQHPVATIGRPEIWPADKAMESEVGKKWTRPTGGADYWLVRLACTLREPGGQPAITEATQTLYLRPKNPAAGERGSYAFSLFPDRLGVQDQSEFNISLKPELKFTSVELKPGELGAKISYRKVFAVIQSYGAGEPAPYWIFKPHPAYPLDGSQFVYAVVAAQSGADGARASVELTVTIETKFGPVRLGLPQEARAHVSFTIP